MTSAVHYTTVNKRARNTKIGRVIRFESLHLLCMSGFCSFACVCVHHISFSLKVLIYPVFIYTVCDIENQSRMNSRCYPVASLLFSLYFYTCHKEVLQLPKHVTREVGDDDDGIFMTQILVKVQCV